MTAKADFLGYHAYSWPSIHNNREHNTLRYRRITQGIADNGHTPPPVILTEAGLDGGVEHKRGLGWKSAPASPDLSAEQSYFDQLTHLRNWASRDNVWAILPFVAGPNPDWSDFEINHTLARFTRDQLHHHPATPPPSSRKRGRGV